MRGKEREEGGRGRNGERGGKKRGKGRGRGYSPYQSYFASGATETGVT